MIPFLAEPSLQPANYTFEIEDCPRILVSSPQQIEPLRKHSRYRMYFLSINLHKTSPYLQNIHRAFTVFPALCKNSWKTTMNKTRETLTHQAGRLVRMLSGVLLSIFSVFLCLWAISQFCKL